MPVRLALTSLQTSCSGAWGIRKAKGISLRRESRIRTIRRNGCRLLVTISEIGCRYSRRTYTLAYRRSPVIPWAWVTVTRFQRDTGLFDCATSSSTVRRPKTAFPPHSASCKTEFPRRIVSTSVRYVKLSSPPMFHTRPFTDIRVTWNIHFTARWSTNTGAFWCLKNQFFREKLYLQIFHS